jgi:hypothetical protein
VQGFVDVSSDDGPGVTLAPLDAFALRLDLEPISFEALGNDQNYREVTQDQDGATDFRFRYALRAHGAGYAEADTVAWARSVATPLLAGPGSLRDSRLTPAVRLDPARALAMCLKPAEGSPEELILRLWETAGVTGPLALGTTGFRRAYRCDLLERDLEELPIHQGQITLPVRGRGLAAIRLVR